MTSETCQSLECTTPELFAYAVSVELNLLTSHDGVEEIPLLTETDIEITL